MPLGWIDFSRTERNKVLSVLDLLLEGEEGSLDELGIGPVRDGFANRFFPGTTTLQRRAKYFFLVPYILKDLEHESETDPRSVLHLLDERERECAEQLLKGKDTDGIIGSISLKKGKWVKQTPTDIYWSGLRSYGIFTSEGGISLNEYIRAVCMQKQEKADIVKSGNRNDQTEEKDADDNSAGGLSPIQFWNIPTYKRNWKKNLSIKLTPKEGAFLKKQIIGRYPDSMLAYVLKEEITDFLRYRCFQDLNGLISRFPKEMQKVYQLAFDFAEFYYILRFVYFMAVLNNRDAVEEWKLTPPDMKNIAAKVDLEQIFKALLIPEGSLTRFLRKSKELMLNDDFEGMNNEIRERARAVRANRGKAADEGASDTKKWNSGGKLSYRFERAYTIIHDIFESEGHDVKSK